MRIATLSVGGAAKVAVATDGGLVDVGATARLCAPNSSWVDASLRDLVAGGAEAMGFLRRVEAAADVHRPIKGGFEHLSPILDPPRVFCIGRNYEEHAAEGNAPVPDFPMIFLKPATTLSGHDQEVVVPPTTQQVDWEGELAVVVGMPGRDIPEETAWRHVAGVTVANDLTARDWQRRTSQFDAGKMFDGFGPMGPFLVTADELTDVASLVVETRVNGTVMQRGVVGQMVFPIPYLISYLSQAVRLLPGDVILTGTPPGVGYARTPPVFLGDGDAVEVSIGGIGELRSHIRLRNHAGAADAAAAARTLLGEST